MNHLQSLDEKYADFLINYCFPVNKNRPIIILYKGKELEPFAYFIANKVKKKGFENILFYNTSQYEQMDYLYRTNMKNIKKESYLDVSSLEYAAINNGFILQLDAYEKEFEHKVSNDKLIKCSRIINSQFQDYPNNFFKLKCTGTVVVYPTKDWAKKIYPNLPEEKAYEKLYLQIMKMNLLDTKDPIKTWEELKNKYQQLEQRINQLQIKRLHYQDTSGTDLFVDLPKEHIWCTPFNTDYFGNHFMANMPSYEIFTSPIAHSTNGTVFFSKPVVLYQTNNYILDHFGLTFKNGKVVDIITKSKRDYNVLNDLFTAHPGAKFLGECALVENNTPICKTDTLFYHALLDENTSCHLALGFAIRDAIKQGLHMSHNELSKTGINLSAGIHIDAMMDSNHLEIEADTKDGKKLIYQRGKITI